MHLTIILFSVIFLTFVISNSAILPMKYFSNTSGFLFLLRIGFPGDPFYATIDINFPYTIITTPFFFSKSYSKTYRIIDSSNPLLINKTLISSYILEDDFSIHSTSDFTINNFTFFYANFTSAQIPNIVGLATSQYSILHKLASSQRIYKEAIAFGMEDDEGEGYVFLGGFPSIVVKDNDVFESIFNTKKGKFTLNVNGLFIGNEPINKYNLNMVGIIETNTKYIKIPQKVFNFLYTNLFEQFVKERKCFVYNDPVNKIVCKYEVMMAFPQITFIVRNSEKKRKDNYYLFEYNNRDLWICERVHEYTFLIIVDYLNNDNNYIHIGTAFYKNHYVEFSYSDKMFHIYHSNKTGMFQKIPILNETSFTMLILIKLNIIVILLQLIHMFIIINV